MLRYLFFLSLFIAGCSGCKEPGCPSTLIYEIATQVFPMKDSLSIGDTLWVECVFDDHLIDQSQGIENNFIDYDFQSIWFIKGIDTVPTRINVMEDFKTISENGGVKPFFRSDSIEAFFIINFDYTNKKYHFKSGLIAKKKGQYLMFIGALEDILAPLKAQDNCTKSNLDLVFNVNQHEGNHFEMIANCPDEFIKRYYTLEQFNLEGGYCFVVK
jgi:hypothetical protein